MPSTIPYDPALALGNLVSLDRLEILEQIAAAQAPADAAEDTLNSLIAAKRSLDMTSQELAGMGIDTSDVDGESAGLGKDVSAAALDFAKAKVAAIKLAQPLKAKMSGIADSVESPVDYNRTQIKQMPLSADSLRMNVQFFTLDQNTQASGTHAAKIASFISGQVGIFGDEFSSQAAGSAASQVNSQVQNHSISGTLVISVTCTHKNAVLLAPFILDVDKGIRAFNAYFPDSMIKTDPTAPKNLSIVPPRVGKLTYSQWKITPYSSDGAQVGVSMYAKSGGLLDYALLNAKKTVLATPVDSLAGLADGLTDSNGLPFLQKTFDHFPVVYDLTCP